MLKLLFPLPKRVIVAFSGGVDSVAIVDFLSRKHDVACAFFHHRTENSDKALDFVAKFCTERNLPMFVGHLAGEKPKKMSWEEYWRVKRYDYLEMMAGDDYPVITGHHLDDCVETYLWSCMHGKPKVPQLKRGNIWRPFLTTPKNKLIDWCQRKNVSWCEDTSNDDTNYTRNYIRHKLMPHALKVNPGLHKVVKKIVEQNLLLGILSE